MKKVSVLLMMALICWTLAPAPPGKAEPSGDALWAMVLEETLKEKDQALISPISLEVALKMAAQGAKGETLDEMLKALGESEPDLEKMGERLKELKQAGVVSASGLYTGPGVTLEDAYLSALEQALDARYFTQQGEALKPALDEWISEATQGLIKKYPFEIDLGQGESQWMVVLLNALSLKAKWEKPFVEAENGVFHGPDGDVEVPMLNQTTDYAYQQMEDGTQCVYLPYESGDLGMTLLLPGEDGLEALVKRLREDPSPYLKTAAQPTCAVSLTMPTLDLSVENSLKQTLKAVMPISFSNLADFGGMSAESKLGIGDVQQNVRLKVDEMGTEAAAATAVVLFPMSAVLSSVEVCADRPYAFMISDPAGENILFAGAIRTPA